MDWLNKIIMIAKESGMRKAKIIKPNNSAKME